MRLRVLESIAAEGTYLLKLRGDFEWDREAFDRLIIQMQVCCQEYEQAEMLPRWLVRFFWDIPSDVEGITSSEHQQWKARREQDPQYYLAAYNQLRSMSLWFLTGRPNDEREEEIHLPNEYHRVQERISHSILPESGYLSLFGETLWKEWRGEDQSFCASFEKDGRWNQDAFNRMTDAMQGYCMKLARAEMQPRWLVAFYWMIPEVVADKLLSSEQMVTDKRSEEVTSYDYAYKLIRSLSEWFFIGEYRSPDTPSLPTWYG